MSNGYFVYASGRDIHALRHISRDGRLLMDWDQITVHVTKRLKGAPWVGDFSFWQKSAEDAVGEVMAEIAQKAADLKKENPTRAAKLTIQKGATYVGKNSTLTHLGFGNMG